VSTVHKYGARRTPKSSGSIQTTAATSSAARTPASSWATTRIALSAFGERNAARLNRKTYQTI
jgi:hypothetical protein